MLVSTSPRGASAQGRPMLRRSRSSTSLGEWSIPGADGGGHFSVAFRKVINVDSIQLIALHQLHLAPNVGLCSTRNMDRSPYRLSGISPIRIHARFDGKTMPIPIAAENKLPRPDPSSSPANADPGCSAATSRPLPKPSRKAVPPGFSVSRVPSPSVGIQKNVYSLLVRDQCPV
jgi:hypothetical protein